MTIEVMPRSNQRRWWKESTVYQIYPASFKDHADGGHGTLLGILEKIPYLHDLGVDIVWLSPIYESPHHDMGYDISDYQKIDPRYGTMEDWDRIRDACHARGMKLVMDLVVNHSSDEHPWFKESRSSKTNPKRNWYIWHPGKMNDKGERIPPSNWRSMFGAGSAWEWDEGTQEYYLHLFAKEQPDLNWENPEVRAAVYKMMRWWLDRGTDGFRMDVINFTAKAPGFPDAPLTDDLNEFQHFGELSANRPAVHGYLREMHERVLKDYDSFCVGECPGTDPLESYAVYSIPENKELQMVFNFHHLRFDRCRAKLARGWNPSWKLSELKKIFNDWHQQVPKLGGWMSNYMDNHDQPRMLSRIATGHPDHRVRSAKLVCMLQTTLTGTIFVFQGQEMGQINFPRTWGEEEYKDIESVQMFEGERRRLTETGATQAAIDAQIEHVLENLQETARDNGRTPVQWDSSENAGFTKGTPWMRVHDDYKQWNIKLQQNDKNSVWTFWQRMLALRKEHPALVYGKFIPLDAGSEENYTYMREDEETGEKLLVVLNLAPGDDRLGLPITVDVPGMGVDVSTAELLVANDGAEEGSGFTGPLELGPWCGRIYLLQHGHTATPTTTNTAGHSNGHA